MQAERLAFNAIGNIFYIRYFRLHPDCASGRCTGAPLRRLKKFAAHFFNSDFVGTRRKDAPYAGTDRIRNFFINEVFTHTKPALFLINLIFNIRRTIFNAHHKTKTVIQFLYHSME